MNFSSFNEESPELGDQIKTVKSALVNNINYSKISSKLRITKSYNSVLFNQRIFT